MKRILLKKDTYYDSVFLMLVSRELKGRPGVADAIVAMGTPMNLELLEGLGYAKAELAGLTPGDLVVAVDAADEKAAEGAIEAAFEIMKRKKSQASQGAGAQRAGSVRAAAQLLPEANVAVISVPGRYAAREARLALEAGRHVMLFSDNVSLEEEIELKRLAVSKGLLLMGPDCGTAIIGGKPLCFANVVRRGSIGAVAASGTGLQEFTCLVDRYGSGISQAVGTGGRDLKNAAVGGMTSLLAIEALARDPATKVLAVVSKPPAPEVADKVVAALAAAGKPAVVHFLGLKERKADGPRLAFAADLAEAAKLAVAFDRGAKDAAAARAAAAGIDSGAGFDLAAAAAREAAKLGPRQRFLRGLFTGGTLADECLFLAHAALPGGVRSNNQTDPAFGLADPRVSAGHTVVDLGDDFFTAGKPHPMIDPSPRDDRIRAEGADPEVAVLVLDVVLGYGSHPDPAGAAAAAVAEAKAAAAARGGHLPVVASLVGTAADPQDYAAQRAALEAAGVIVTPSNFQAAGLAVEICRLAAKGGRA